MRVYITVSALLNGCRGKKEKGKYTYCVACQEFVVILGLINVSHTDAL